MRWERLASRMAAMLALLACSVILSSATGDRFDEHLTIRPLADGRLHTSFSFDLWSVNSDNDDVPIYSMVPRSLIHLAKASDALEIHLAINAGRWNYQSWGKPSREDMVGTGAEVWAKLRRPDSKAALRYNETISQPTMANWRKLSANLAGLFCASLDALDERLTVEPFDQREEKASTITLHAMLASESICTENLSTLLKLLPCKTVAGLASLLKPHKFFTADFHGMTLHMELVDGSWRVKMNVQAVFAPVMQPIRQKRDWSLNHIFGSNLQQSCPLVHASHITVVAPPLRGVADVSNTDGEIVDFTIWPIVIGPDGDENEEKTIEQKAALFAQALQREGQYTYDTRASTDLNVEMRWSKEKTFVYPTHYDSPSLLASRVFTGFGQERGVLLLTICNSAAIKERRVTYSDMLPRFLKPYLHTLSVQVQADEFDEDEDNVVRFREDLTAPLLLSLEYSPSPFHFEAKLRIPPQSTVRLSLEYDKSFLRYAEHPPDAHRGFDVAPAFLLLEDGSKVYTEPGLIEVAVPDFSMPYNVIIFTSTLIALCAGSTLNNLLRRYADVIKSP